MLKKENLVQAKNKITMAKYVALGSVGTVLASPVFAFADDYKSTINSITERGSELLNTIGYAILILIAGLALISLGKEILPAIFAKETPEFKTHTKVAIVVIVMCIIAGFLPLIINSITQIANQGVNLGTVNG